MMLHKVKYFVIIIFLFLCAIAYSDYTLVCTFFGTAIAKEYRISDEGDIKDLYTVKLEVNAETLVFSPDGHWGMAGAGAYYTNLLDISPSGLIKCFGKINKIYESSPICCISPDSSIGIYDVDLKSIKMNKNKSYKTFTGSNSFHGVFGDFSKYNNKLYCMDTIINTDYAGIYEYQVNSDLSISETGVKYELLDNSPRDLKISPDGKTGIALTGWQIKAINVFSIKKEGGFTITQQLNIVYPVMNPCGVGFTPDSKLAVICYEDSVQSYTISEDSQLTLKQTLLLPDDTACEDMAITPDGKYVVSRHLGSTGNTSTIIIVRVNADGTLEYLSSKDFPTSPAISAMAFLPPYKDYLTNSWIMY